MSNLFSVFDPQSSYLTNWVSSIILIFLMPSWFWISKNYLINSYTSIIFYLEKEFKMNFSPSPTPGHTHWCISLFFLILMNNFMGLTPYTFTSSSHLTFCLSLGLVFWLSYLLFSFIKDLTHSLAHLVPLGTPWFLLPVMVIIETISIMIRPITLSVRLSANLVAGHLLMTLCASPANLNNPMTIMIMVPILVLLVLESAVAWIQAYVFSMLSSLYLSEVNFATLQI